ncbi:MAG TPA: fused MFS/spermidine synthase [Bryobacteraceae bacterium]|jgi:SAM-dependent methyltransferase|nr:fused MFS/spermidine synthase [Bryobacteraceae bacterium]
MLFYTVTIFLSAFLLFEVQPIIAKTILPWFGGTSAVWSTCMLFFQLVLLLGYLYAHWLHRTLVPRRQALAHIALLAGSLAALPILPNPAWKQAGVAQPSLRILALLAVTVGLPYFLLSSTSPLLQAWYARNHKEGLPYRLFALSNLASMLALLSYPLLIEPNLPTRMQGLVWSAAYVCFAAFCGVTAWRASTQPQVSGESVPDAEQAGDSEPGWTVRLLWLGLAASASVLLLAVTTHLTQDVAAIPFLWLLPLSLYLLSFIICFEAPRLYRRVVFIPLLFAALFFMAYRLWIGHASMPHRLVISLLALALFVACMVCHGELVRLKPHPRYLTGFYVIVSLGGAVGGLFVGLMAPNLFRAYYEFPIGLALCAVVAFIVFTKDLWRISPLRKGVAMVVLMLMLGGYLFFLGSIMHTMVSGYRVVERNFYGQLRVHDVGNPRTDEDAVRRFVHGTINHGEQSLRQEHRRQPITYFCENSGIGRAMRAQESKPRRIGILGLGCGTLAAYGKAGDTLRIYEINPLVLDIAQNQFTYLSDTPAKVEVAMGDGRLVLESEKDSQQFDLLVMDAFSGDSVPVHLITREAFATYFRHLKPHGILAVNISNAYLDLEPVMERAANAFDKVALVYHYDPSDEDFLCFGCSWTLIMDHATADTYPELRTYAKELHPGRPFRIWTDDFSNMYSILK